MKSKTGSLLRQPLLSLISVLIFSMGLAGGYLSYQRVKQSQQQRFLLQQAEQMRLLSQQLDSRALAVLGGQTQSVSAVQASLKQAESAWRNLLQGDDQHLALSDWAADIKVNQIALLWSQIQQDANFIVQAGGALIELRNDLAPLLATLADLQVDQRRLLQTWVDDQANMATRLWLQRQLSLIEKITLGLRLLDQIPNNAIETANALASDAALLQLIFQGLLQGDADLRVAAIEDDVLRASLTAINNSFNQVMPVFDGIVEASPQLATLRLVATNLTARSNRLLLESSRLIEQIQNHYGRGWLANPWLPIGLAIFGLMLFALLLLGYGRQGRTQMTEVADSQETDQALLQWLDELTALAQGDLTIQSKSRQGLFGSLADAFNHAIKKIGHKMATAQSGITQLLSGVQKSQETAKHLAEAAAHQAQAIDKVTSTLGEMTTASERIASDAGESTAVAERSLAITQKGIDGVQATIQGMDNIREQIQETAKRIKRLGESSQEIGDIIALIHDIADQTSLLALNAAIQASAAGEAGRGFANVADEVQRLAEHSTAATKQIELLVNTIQGDTNEAIISMEQTVAEVVRGAHLAQDADVALEQMDQVVQNLAQLIQNISKLSRNQTSSTSHLTHSINVIQEIANKTSAGSRATVHSIGQLKQQASKLLTVMAGFKLPQGKTHRQIKES